jgi:hypothetical protein
MNLACSAFPPRVLLAFACAAFCGCVETRFAAPLGDTDEPCDARWKGVWSEFDQVATARADDATVFQVGDDCVLTVLEQPAGGGPPKRVRVALDHARADGKDYLVVEAGALVDLVTLDPPHAVDPAPANAYFYARYRVHGERIDLYAVDSARVARLVIDGTADGTVDKRANELHVFVRGSQAQMLDLVRHHAIFEAQPSLRLVRDTRTLDDHERSMQRRTGAAR